MYALALVASLASVAVHAQAPQPKPTDGWVLVAFNDYGTYEAKEGSFVVRDNKSNQRVATVTGKIFQNSTKTTEFQKWYVKLSDCADKEGKIVTLGLDGEFKYDNDFIIGATTVGTAKADFICGVYDFQMAEKRKKSL